MTIADTHPVIGDFAALRLHWQYLGLPPGIVSDTNCSLMRKSPS
jgi:hypothetical protein